MAKRKISQLTELTTLADGDLMPIVDVSDTSESTSGTVKSVSFGTILEAVSGIGGGGVDSVFGRTGTVTAQSGDYDWSEIDKSVSDIADITTRSHTSLSDIGTNTHAQIDSHMASGEIHHNTESIQDIIGAMVSGNVESGISATYDDTNAKLDFSVGGVVSGVTQLDVDNIRIDGNTISSTNTNGDIQLSPNGTGEVLISTMHAPTSAGVTIHNNSHANIALFGAGGGQGVTFYDGVQLDASTSGRILSTDANKNITALNTSTYPSLTELSYVKGVTSSIQSQLDGKIANTLVDAKGDLITATADNTPAKLTAGTNYYSLISDSATSTGLKWADRGYVNVKDYGAVGDGSTDDSTAFANAIATGKDVYVPGTTSSYLLNTGVTLATAGQSIFGDGKNSKIKRTSGTALTLTGGQNRVYSLSFEGGYVASNYAIVNNNAPQSIIEDVDIRLFDVGIRWVTNGFHFYINNIYARNMRTYIIELPEYSCVGAFITNLTYDTDGTWYGGSYSEPTAGIRVCNQGNIIANVDLIHPGQGIVFETNSNHVEWHLVQDSFIADSGQSGNAGIYIYNTSSTYYVRGLFFDNVWSATNERGVMIDKTGSAAIDGVRFNNCHFHNNRREGARVLDGKNISFTDCQFEGNDSGNNNANNLYINSADGIVQVNGGYFGRSLQWVTDPAYHIYVDTAATDVKIYNPVLDTNATSDRYFFGASNVDYTNITSAETVFNEHGLDKDLRIEGDSDANLIYTDAGNNRVGIGTSTPDQKLDISGNAIIGDETNSGTITLRGSVSGSEGGEINFNGSGSNPTVYLDLYDRNLRVFRNDAVSGTSTIELGNQFGAGGVFDVRVGGSTSSKLGFYGTTPVSRPSAYTQTYSTADKTNAALQSSTLTDNSGGTANTTLEAIGASYVQSQVRNNFADLAAMTNNNTNDIIDLKQLVNSLIDDLQALGLVQ